MSFKDIVNKPALEVVTDTQDDHAPDEKNEVRNEGYKINFNHNKGRKLAWKITKTTLIVLGLAALVVIFVFPVLWMVSNSFKSNDDINAEMASFKTFFPDISKISTWFDNYVNLFNQFEDFGRSILNSIIYCVITIVMVLLINSFAGYALARFKFPGSHSIMTTIILLMIIPVETSVVPLYVILYRLGLLSESTNIIGYLLPGFCSLMYIWMFKQYFQGMPVEIEEAARIDGCSRIGIYFRMILPLSLPIFATVAIFTFMGQWNEYIMAQLIFVDPSKQPLQVYLQLVNTFQPRDLGMVMAALTFSTIPIALVYIFAQKYIVEGVSFSGLK